MDNLVVIALGTYIVLACLTFFVVQAYVQETRKVSQKLRSRLS